MKSLKIALFALLGSASAHAAEGMWTLDNLPLAAMEQQYGWAPDAKWVDHAMKSAVRLAGGCSGSFVSPEGLVLTNAHCVIGCVSEVSSEASDYVNDGFVANNRAAELRCERMELNRLEQISDVTATVVARTQGKTGTAFVDARNAAIAELESSCKAGSERSRCDVVKLYNGARYHLYRYHRFKDVRLVFSPEYAAGFFGGDPDNFNFPRYNLDMGLLRAYEDGKPAQIVDYFPLSTRGVSPGEMTMVVGHPGRTQRLLTVAQLEHLRAVSGFESLLRLGELRGLLLQYSAQGDEQARIAQSDLTSIENSYKVWYGRMKALSSPAIMDAKRREEAELMAAASAEQRLAWSDIAAAQQRAAELQHAYVMLEQGAGFASEYFDFARDLVRAADERGKPNGERLPAFQDARLPLLEQNLLGDTPIYADYEQAKLSWSLSKLRERLGVDDPLVKLVLGRESPAALAKRMVETTQLGSVEVRRALWNGGAKAVSESTDPFIELARAVDGASRAVRAQMESSVESVEARAAEQIAAVRFARYGTRIYPDATFTLRLSYGEVKAWEERGQQLDPFTQFAGLFSRATGADPFRLAPRWVKAQPKLDMSTPFNYVTTNDIIGGNSGSPVINRDGQVVGLAFDGNIHSNGGAYAYDESNNRCVAVDSRAMVSALKTVYGAEALVKELAPQKK